MPHPTAPRPTDKPAKPYEDFPLFPHATRRWAKKIRGKMHYFVPWEDCQAAPAKHQAQKDDLFAGRKARGASGDGLTVRDLLNRFLTSKKQLVDSNEITARTFADYYAVCERIKSAFGVSRLVSDLRPEDFEKLRGDLSRT